MSKDEKKQKTLTDDDMVTEPKLSRRLLIAGAGVALGAATLGATPAFADSDDDDEDKDKGEDKDKPDTDQHDGENDDNGEDKDDDDKDEHDGEKDDDEKESMIEESRDSD